MTDGNVAAASAQETSPLRCRETIRTDRGWERTIEGNGPFTSQDEGSGPFTSQRQNETATRNAGGDRVAPRVVWMRLVKC